MSTVIKRESELEKLRLDFEKRKERAIKRGKCTEEDIEKACKKETSREVKMKKRYLKKKKELASKFVSFAPFFLLTGLVFFSLSKNVYFSFVLTAFLYFFIRHLYINSKIYRPRNTTTPNYVVPKTARKIARYFAVHENELKGAWGEKSVSDYIEKSFEKQYYLLNDVNVRYKNKPSQIDHLLICPRGIFCFETKNYAVNKFYQADDEQWSFNVGKSIDYIKSPQFQSSHHADILAGILPQEKIRIFPVVVLVNEKSNYIGDSYPCPVIHINQVKKFVLSHPEVYSEDFSRRLAYKVLRINRLH